MHPILLRMLLLQHVIVRFMEGWLECYAKSVDVERLGRALLNIFSCVKRALFS
jgi:hypothetical protein